MPPRKKTKLEKWFSFNQHKRRFGANKVYQAFSNDDIESLKSTIIPGDTAICTYGSAKDLNEHIENLKHEFIGQPELNYFHASLIVLIRREVDIDKNYQKFKELWLTERDFLLQHLNTRWLISACDTFIDHDEDKTLQAILMNAVGIINTVKLQETEHLLCGSTYEIDEQIKQKIHDGWVGLFDGTSAFNIGSDDTLRNMRWRLDKVCAYHELGQIVIEIFERLQNTQNNNVYSRFRQRHTRERTRWW